MGRVLSIILVKSKAFLSLESVSCLRKLALFVNLYMLELSYSFQTLVNDPDNSYVRFRKRINSKIVTKSPCVNLKHAEFFYSSDFWNTDIYYNKVHF